MFGDYKITRQLAVGGMGAVYLAEHRGLKKVVKFMLGEFAAIPELRMRFQRECDAAIKLKGKTNIVAIDSHSERDGELYLVMEYLDGETLEDHIKRRCGRISVRHAFRLIAQIVAALHELHSADIIHRDLKPQNVFVVHTDEEPYRVKLIDFGIVHDRRAAARLQGGTRRGAMIGTPGYAAIEQFLDAGNVTPATDVFALAVMIFEMFCGQRPWSGSTDYELYDNQRTKPAQLPPGHHMPPGWEPIILAALSPNPADRPPLHALLYALARDIPAEPPEPDGFQMVTRYAPRVLMNTPVDVETVRASDAQQASAALWALRRATAVPEGQPSPAWFSSDAISLTAPGYTPPSVPIASGAPASSSDAPATVNARPRHAIAPAQPITTHAAASGVIISQPLPGSTPQRRAVLLAFGGFLLVAVLGTALTFGVTRLHGGGEKPQSTFQPLPASVRDAGIEATFDAPLEANAPADAAPSTWTNAAALPDAAGAPTESALDSGEPKTARRPTTTNSPSTSKSKRTAKERAPGSPASSTRGSAAPRDTVIGPDDIAE